MTSHKIVASNSLTSAADGEDHIRTYRGFVKFVEISTIVVICWVLSLAIGGIKEAWTTAVIGVIVSALAGAFGAVMPSVGLRAPVIIAFALLLLLMLY